MAELFDSLAGWTRFTHHFYTVLNCSFPSRLELASDVISGIFVGPVVPDNRVRHFRPFLNFDNCQSEVVRDVISGMADQDGGMDVCANFGDSRLKPSKASFSAFLRRR